MWSSSSSAQDGFPEFPLRRGESEPQRTLLGSGASPGSCGSVLGDLRGAGAVAGGDRNPHRPASTTGYRHRRSPPAAGPDEGKRSWCHTCICFSGCSDAHCPPLCPSQLLRESIAEHKPHIDKLLKIGPQLAELSLQEGAAVTQRYADAERRYQAIKDEVKGRATVLDEAVSQSAQV